MRFERLWLPSSWLKDEWLSTSTAAKLFFLSVLSVIALTLEYNLDISAASYWQHQLWDALGVLEAISILFLWLGMWRYWTRIDDSNRSAKRLWFLVLLIGFWWGSALYYFLVYLPQTVRRRRVEA